MKGCCLFEPVSFTELKKSLPPSTVTCQQSSQPMILLQQAGLPPHPHPEKPSSPPMSVATRPRANSPLSPQKPFGLGPSLQHSQEEVAKVVEQDPVLEELCKPLCCKLCSVTLNSAQQAQAHYQVRRIKGRKMFRLVVPVRSQPHFQYEMEGQH